MKTSNENEGKLHSENLPEPGDSQNEKTTIQLTLNFIEDFLNTHFNGSDKVPAPYLTVSKEVLNKQTAKLVAALSSSETIDRQLCDLLIQNFNTLIPENPETITFAELDYRKQLIKELLVENSTPSSDIIRDKLYCFNFNEGNFVLYEFIRLQQLTENHFTTKQKIAALQLEQKLINQIPVKVNTVYNETMPYLRVQVNSWIAEEIKFLEKVILPEPTENTTEIENKIHTSLSVAKLALFIRILVIDKIIINRAAAPMLRIVAKVFTSLQKEEISFGSLETKFHSPDKATITALKDMLFKWINILSRL
jgi:hypothetical protein